MYRSRTKYADRNFTLIFPSWPDLPSGFSFAFSLSVGLAAFAALMPQLIWLYKYFELDTRGEKYFEMEEVILQYDEKHPVGRLKQMVLAVLAEAVRRRRRWRRSCHALSTKHIGVRSGSGVAPAPAPPAPSPSPVSTSSAKQRAHHQRAPWRRET